MRSFTVRIKSFTQTQNQGDYLVIAWFESRLTTSYPELFVVFFSLPRQASDKTSIIRRLLQNPLQFTGFPINGSKSAVRTQLKSFFNLYIYSLEGEDEDASLFFYPNRTI